MIIRDAHFETLVVNHYLDFEGRTSSWLEGYFPEDCALLGPNAMRIRIRQAVQTAARYGFASQRDAAQFVYLWFMLGPHFDLSPEYAWLAQMLAAHPEDPEARMGRAFEALAEHFEAQESRSIR